VYTFGLAEQRTKTVAISVRGSGNKAGDSTLIIPEIKAAGIYLVHDLSTYGPFSRFSATINTTSG
jgi:hypothetical protein